MRFISTKTHAVNDYIFGAALIVIPLFYLTDENSPAVWVPVCIGALLLLQSLLTDYEISMANLIPIKVHLGMDVLAGVVLAASPWLFQFSERVWVPHVVVGILEIGLALTTRVHRTDPAHYPNPPSRAATTTH